MSSGYVRLSRKFFKHSFWKESRIYSPAEAWLDLISSARFEEEPERLLVNLKIVNINRGELRASQRYLANRWRWSLSKVNGFIKLLLDERMIERRTEHSETIIIIKNYEVYNVSEKRKSEQEPNDDETLPEQTKEGKEGEEIKEVITPIPPEQKKPPKQKKREVDHILLKMPFETERFKMLWGELVKMPKWAKKPLTALDQSLKSLGNYDEEFACNLIKRAIEGNYQGVVFTGTDADYERWKKGKSNGKILEPTDEKRQKLLEEWK